MTIHYHGTPITPRSTLLRLAGRHFCVSFARPDDVAVCHDIGQSVMLDNGAFSIWRGTGENKADWRDYYSWSEKWLEYWTTWAVIPDVIEGGEDENDRLLNQWPHGIQRGSPVWHLHESLDRLSRLCSVYPRVCLGSSSQYAIVGSPSWSNRMVEVFNHLVETFREVPCWLHMLRGMAHGGGIFPFASVDSTDVAQNWKRTGDPVARADRWDANQCPARWTPRPTQPVMKYPPVFAVDLLPEPADAKEPK